MQGVHKRCLGKVFDQMKSGSGKITLHFVQGRSETIAINGRAQLPFERREGERTEVRKHDIMRRNATELANDPLANLGSGEVMKQPKAYDGVKTLISLREPLDILPFNRARQPAGGDILPRHLEHGIGKICADTL